MCLWNVMRTFFKYRLQEKDSCTFYTFPLTAWAPPVLTAWAPPVLTAWAPPVHQNSMGTTSTSKVSQIFENAAMASNTELNTKLMH